jgi:hypothetical protein
MADYNVSREPEGKAPNSGAYGNACLDRRRGRKSQSVTGAQPNAKNSLSAPTVQKIDSFISSAKLAGSRWPADFNCRIALVLFSRS